MVIKKEKADRLSRNQKDIVIRETARSIVGEGLAFDDALQIAIWTVRPGFSLTERQYKDLYFKIIHRAKYFEKLKLKNPDWF